MEPLSQSKSKLFASLLHKKYRLKHGLFLAEGIKCVEEALRSTYTVEAIVVREGTAEGITDHTSVMVYQAGSEQFQKLTDQPNPEGILAILHTRPFSSNLASDAPALYMDAIQDPGNLGAIFRVADWFGVRQTVLGPGTVDPYHPKVVRSSMGSVFRMTLTEPQHQEEWLQKHTSRLWLADLEGSSLANASPARDGILVIGNEARGVSEHIRSLPGVSRIRIPGGSQTESLNAAVATGILMWEWQKGQL